MTDYPYEGTLIADPVTFQRAVRASITVYDWNDTNNSTPLALKDLSGLPLANPLTSSADAFVQPFITTSDGVKLVGGGLTVVAFSPKGIRDAAEASALAAQEAAGAASDAAGSTLATATVNGSGRLILTKADASIVDAGAVVGPQGSTGATGPQGPTGAQGPAGVADDASIAAQVSNGASATRAALNATIASEVAAPISAAVAPKLDSTTAATTYVSQSSAAAAKGIKTASVATSGYTLGLGDRGNAVEINAATDTRVIVPLTSSVDFPVGTEVEVVRIGAGGVSIEPTFRNFCTNPTMELDFAGWVARTGGLTRDPAAALLGGYGARATSTASGQNFGFFYQIPGALDTLGLKVGDAVSARINVRSAFANGGQIAVRFQAGTTTVSQSSFGAAVVNGVALIENAIIPAGTDNIMIVSQAVSTASSQIVDWDGLIVVKGATAPAAYADGDTAGYGWLGTAHASQSSGPLFRDSGLTLGKFGRAILRKRAANEWVLGNALPNEALLTTGTLQTDRDNGQPGMVAPGTPLSTLSTVALTSGRACLARFVPSRTMYITKLAFRVQTASGTDDPCDVGIYDSSGTRLVSSGAKTALLNTTGTKFITITTTKLTAGVPYYAAFAATSTASLSHVNVIGDGFGAGAPALELQKKDASYPLPSSLTGLGGSDSGPVIFVRES